MMGTNQVGAQPREMQQAKNLLGGAILKAEHMIFVGCAGLVLALVACGVITWYTITGWSTPADPAPVDKTTGAYKLVEPRPGEVEHWSFDNCPGEQTKFYTVHGMVCR